ncbi:hypothetical protein GIB67_010024 [Kingdonia uniflora]|uniref:C2 domain-containing protein n=1 Tax=Kingdonia uniflora TaxID=39325 RepID=A0A7J7KV40_9MAGN|nr:hypothetical protein GIB67_010024 [Kingdonia uniflora]
MGENRSRKLVVEVMNARNLMPKDGQGTSSPYVIVDFDGQRRRTKTKCRDLNPQFDEKLEFLVHNVESMGSETVEVNVYNDKKTVKKSSFLGKVKVSGNSFMRLGDETLVYYPLEKRSVFSQIKGEIGLKICYVDDEAPPPPVVEGEAAKAQTVEVTEEKKTEEEKSVEKAVVEETPATPMPTPVPIPSKDEAVKPPSTPNALEEKSSQKTPMHKRHYGSSGVSDLEAIRSIRSLGGDNRNRSSYDLVDRMPFLYVRVLKAKRTNADTESSSDLFAKLVIGTHSIRTKSVTDKDWDQVFAFDKEGLNSTALEVSVFAEKKETNAESSAVTITDLALGTVSFDLQEAPKRVPPDSPLAPEWYALDGLGSGENVSSSGTEVMLAVWIGTQADEAFQEAWQSDSGGLVAETRAKVYLSPKLWYLRVTVIQTQDLQLGSGGSAAVSPAPEPKAARFSELYVKAQLGPQVFKTSRIPVGSASAANPTWNEDLVFVAAEPFEPFLVLTVEDVSSGSPVGSAKVHLPSVDRRTDDLSESRSRWFNLVGDETRPYTGRIHVRVCLEGGYHVLDEAAHVTSDVRAAAKHLSRPPIGLLEVGIRGATNLLPVKTMDGTRGTTDAYVVAKYGPKWVRTRTILDRFNPRWNEQYTWDVYDACTVLTIGVFDNGRYKHDGTGKPGKDARMGKLRIRLSALDTNRVYVNTYSLTVLHPGGAKKMGEIELAVRFSCSSWINLLQAYSTPMLPKMHYVRPLAPAQQDILRYTAMRIVTARLARSEPPMGHEVVQFMLDSDTHVWSMRRSKANWFRVVGCLSRALSFARWLDGIRTWAYPSTTILVHALLVSIVLCPHLVLPTAFLYAFFIVALRFRFRPKSPGNMDPRASYIDSVGTDDLDEELDGLPSTRPAEIVRMRYDRLRALAGRAQTLLGDIAAQGERVEALFNWRDPRATGIFVVFCLLASLAFYIVPFKVFVLGYGFYYLRHPRFRDDMPSVPVNFFRRLPSFSDQIL